MFIKCKEFLRSLALACLLALPVGAQAAEVTLEDAWTPPSLAGAKAHAAFVTIVHEGRAPDVLESASSPLFGAVELHAMDHAEGKMRMRKLENLPIPPQSRILLAPRGLHLMLFEPKAALKEGDRLPLTLHFRRAGVLETSAEVRAAGGHHH